MYSFIWGTEWYAMIYEQPPLILIYNWWNAHCMLQSCHSWTALSQMAYLQTDGPLADIPIADADGPLAKLLCGGHSPAQTLWSRKSDNTCCNNRKTDNLSRRCKLTFKAYLQSSAHCTKWWNSVQWGCYIENDWVWWGFSGVIQWMPLMTDWNQILKLAWQFYKS